MISFETFDEFHQSFHGEFFQMCVDCGGICEYCKIGPLLPGEKHYMANKLNMDLHQFENKYLDGINTEYGIINVIKLKPICLFLRKDCSCGVRKIKPVFCAIYPIIFSQIEPIMKFDIDINSCPLGKNPVSYEYFKNEGISTLSKIFIPKDWAKAVLMFDEGYYDYYAIRKLRKTDNYQTFELEDIQQFEVQFEDIKKKIERDLIAWQNKC